MKIRYTFHAEQKFTLLRQSGFSISKRRILQTVASPVKVEDRADGTYIATSLIDKIHVLRVVYKKERDIIIIITFYPGRGKAYDL